MNQNGQPHSSAWVSFTYASFAASAFLVAIGIFFLVQVPLSRWWLARHEMGPMEWLWRRLTYGRAVGKATPVREAAA